MYLLGKRALQWVWRPHWQGQRKR